MKEMKKAAKFSPMDISGFVSYKKEGSKSLRETEQIANSERKLEWDKKQVQGGLPPGVPEFGDELLGLLEEWGLKPLEKG